MLTFFAALHDKMANLSSLKLSTSANIDETEIVGADSGRANVGDMKKITIMLIPQIYNEHAHLLCSLMH